MNEDRFGVLRLEPWCLDTYPIQIWDHVKPQIKHVYFQLIEIYFEYMYPYLICLENHLMEKDMSIFASGFIFFIGGLCIILHYSNWGDYIEAICWYNTLYLLFDFYIDSEHISNTNKLMLIELLRVTLKEETQVWTLEEISELNDPVIYTLYETYWKLITKYPKTKAYLQHIFNVQKRSFLLSKEKKHIPKEELYTIALEKGGYTTMVFSAIVGEERKEILDTIYNIGIIMQLLDDFMDMKKDNHLGIETYATYHLLNHHLSDYWKEISERIDTIHPLFTLFKIIYSLLLLYISCCIISKEELHSVILVFCSRHNIVYRNINSTLEEDTFQQYKKMKYNKKVLLV